MKIKEVQVIVVHVRATKI